MTDRTQEAEAAENHSVQKLILKGYQGCFMNDF